MNFQIEKVLERDIDLLVINKFLSDKKFKDLFLSRINLKDYNIEKCIHSYSDENGESDITVILKKDNKKTGLLIENKISAIAMPNQCKRYKIRGKKLFEEGIFDDFYIFIIAPKDYLDSNEEAKKYDNKVSYEEILDYVKYDIYAKSLIEEAIREKKKGYSVVENVLVTSFWHRFYMFVEHKFPMLNIPKHKGPRGSNAQWPLFATPINEIKIYMKADRGFCDLTFPNVSKKYYEVYDIVKDKLKGYMSLQKTNKALAVRINVPVINFKGDFDEQLDDIESNLYAVTDLQEWLKEIDYKKILDLRN